VIDVVTEPPACGYDFEIVFTKEERISSGRHVKSRFECCAGSDDSPCFRSNRDRLHVLRFAFILLGVQFCAALAAQEFLIEPIPGWTTSSEVKDRNNPLEKQVSAGVFALLLDVEINGATRERFLHAAEKFVSSAGVEANSRLSFVFDPSYQRLVIHKVALHRGEQIFNQLEPDRIRVIQQEKDLDRLIYNGSKTALLFLEDVRVGDWVEYAYTVRGRNPIQEEHFFDSLQLSYPFPIQTENYRLLWPRTNPPLRMQISGNAPKNRQEIDSFYEYAWHWENRRGEEIESFLPVSVYPYTLVHFSDYKSWADVANWAIKSFHPERVTEVLYQKIMRIRDENATDEQRVLKALEFVQDDIRYLGIENGVNSHQPTDPSVVFARRYGDCKDKALLFCTILRFFESVDASPVLVSSRFRWKAQSFVATPLIFDHAIVRIILNGKTNFVDVTRSFQRGPLGQRFVDDFGAGVLLDETAPGLITIPFTGAGMPKTLIEEDFAVATNGATELSVTSTFEGRDADLMRQGFASTSRDSLGKNSLDFYQKYYEGIVTRATAEIHDDERFNRVQLVRRFFIPNIWKPARQTNYIACEFVPYGILDRLYIPAKKQRRWPLAVPFPENFIHTIKIQTHERWRVPSQEKTIQTKAFLFHHRTTSTNNQTEVRSQILTLNAGVAVDDMTEYSAALGEIPRYLGLTITKPVAGMARSDSPNWGLWIAGVSYSAVLLIAAIVIYRYQPRTSPEPLLPDPNLTGLGGWLILLGIGLISATFGRVLSLVKTSAVYTTANWSALTDSTRTGYDPVLPPLLLFERFTNLTLVIFALLLVALFFRKKRIFPTVLIAYLSFQAITFTLDEVVAESRKIKTSAINSIVNVPRPATPDMVGALLPLVVWGLYVVRSKRVKLTFVN